MSGPGARPVFVDTGPLYARADEDDAHHETATRLFESIRSGDLVYRPIYTSQAVISEFATLALYKLGHETAVRGLRAILDSESITVLQVDRSTFETAATEFEAYDDQEISFVDHTTAVLADDRDVEHVFAFDGDFRTLGFTVIPEDLAVFES
jgi:predicted nucleic acid-binding protein